eukprot:GHVP01019694.1.p1 GENE.GHVP01019694.1~~GHVP01019694.1.p1  ORF type:complete len:342 (+),score=51.96 GHVP01019694.1:24-1028(+)
MPLPLAKVMPLELRECVKDIYSLQLWKVWQSKMIVVEVASRLLWEPEETNEASEAVFSTIWDLLGRNRGLAIEQIEPKFPEVSTNKQSYMLDNQTLSEFLKNEELSGLSDLATSYYGKRLVFDRRSHNVKEKIEFSSDFFKHVILTSLLGIQKAKQAKSEPEKSKVEPTSTLITEENSNHANYRLSVSMVQLMTAAAKEVPPFDKHLPQAYQGMGFFYLENQRHCKSPAAQAMFLSLRRLFTALSDAMLPTHSCHFEALPFIDFKPAWRDLPAWWTDEPPRLTTAENLQNLGLENNTQFEKPNSYCLDVSSVRLIFGTVAKKACLESLQRFISI